LERLSLWKNISEKDMSKRLKLDPVMARLLPGTREHKRKVKWYLEHRDKITEFMDPRVDYAFKYILGHKEILIKLLNDFLPVQVSDVEYRPNELPVKLKTDKRSSFDVLCTESGTGKTFLCEMQQLERIDMDDRLIFYGCSLVHNQLKRGKKLYLFPNVYVICVSNYLRPHSAPVPEGKIMFKYLIREQEMDENFSDKLSFYILELPRLEKVWERLDTNVEKWCYIFNNLSTFADVPPNSEHFTEVFEVARTGELDNEELKGYLDSMISDYDIRSVGEYFLKDGMEKGESQTIQKFIRAGAPDELISKATGLSAEEIAELREQV